MTHEYTLLVGGVVLPGAGEPAVSAIAWAGGTVLALGTDEQVLGISRGDSMRVDLRGATVIPMGADDAPAWPPAAVLEIGGPADLVVLDRDPRTGPIAAAAVLAILRGGHAVRGSLPAPG